MPTGTRSWRSITSSFGMRVPPEEGAPPRSVWPCYRSHPHSQEQACERTPPPSARLGSDRPLGPVRQRDGRGAGRCRYRQRGAVITPDREAARLLLESLIAGENPLKRFRTAILPSRVSLSERRKRRQQPSTGTALRTADNRPHEEADAAARPPRYASGGRAAPETSPPTSCGDRRIPPSFADTGLTFSGPPPFWAQETQDILGASPISAGLQPRTR